MAQTEEKTGKKKEIKMRRKRVICFGEEYRSYTV
jgi:hypothetical protein